MDDQGGQHHDKHGQEGEAKVELPMTDIFPSMFKEESTSLGPTHLSPFLFHLLEQYLLLGHQILLR